MPNGVLVRSVAPDLYMARGSDYAWRVSSLRTRLGRLTSPVSQGRGATPGAERDVARDHATATASAEARHAQTEVATEGMTSVAPHGQASVPALGAEDDPRASMRAEFERLRMHGRATRRAPERSERGARGGGPRVDELPGETHLTAFGELHVVSHRCAADHHHGARAIAPARHVDGDVVATLALDPQMRGLDFSRALYIDTETTGLMGGTGTVPFLIGTAAFEGEALVVRKYMLRRLGEEVPMLQALAEQLRAASCVVSFNGKSFDWPLLRTRFVMNRVKAPPVPPHLDLLHCARRVFRERMERVRLIDIEREVLGFTRVDDVAGAEIPELYMRYLRGGDPEPIARVIDHNRLDLIALSALLAELVGRFQGLGAENDPRDRLACARVAERAGDTALATALASAATDAEARGPAAAQAWLLRARVARRSGDEPAQEAALQAGVKALEGAPEVDVATRAALHLALAKLYEHGLRDLARAHEHARYTVPAEDEAQRDKRCERLAAKRRAAAAGSN
ncbi:MAG: ribonuclease H-like domain-containing protein [Sandaracinaceae bacterium]|nr:ribonuclease H-like domain-containing protein [Sandaracinaceae bacterium]